MLMNAKHAKGRVLFAAVLLLGTAAAVLSFALPHQPADRADPGHPGELEEGSIRGNRDGTPGHRPRY